LTWEQVPKLLAILSEGRAATCAFLIAFGADWCAVERATLEDFGGIDWCARRVLVRGTKNAKRWAEVPIVAPFGALANRAREWLVAHGAFPKWGKQRVRDLATACKRAGVPRITPRDLRRTHGQILAERGVPPHLIGDMLRHTDGRMAERVYGQRTRETVGRQVSAISRRGYPESNA
jgi:integrase